MSNWKAQGCIKEEERANELPCSLWSSHRHHHHQSRGASEGRPTRHSSTMTTDRITPPKIFGCIVWLSLYSRWVHLMLGPRRHGSDVTNSQEPVDRRVNVIRKSRMHWERFVQSSNMADRAMNHLDRTQENVSRPVRCKTSSSFMTRSYQRIQTIHLGHF